jgi:hypothetical protein
VWYGILEVNTNRKKTDGDEWLEGRTSVNSQELFYDYRLECDDWDCVFKKEINGLLRRYRLFKDYGVTSFSTHYDDLPAFWVDALGIMDEAYNRATREREIKRGR